MTPIARKEGEEEREETLFTNRTSLFPNNIIICPPKPIKTNAFPLAEYTNYRLSSALHGLSRSWSKEVKRQNKRHQITVDLTFLILLKNLHQSWLKRKWLSIQGANAAFSITGVYGQMGLARNSTREGINLLMNMGLLVKSEHSFQARQTALYYPGEALQKVFFENLYAPYKGRKQCGIYIRDKNGLLIKAGLPEDHPELVAIQMLHEHLRVQNIPLYTPLQLVFKQQDNQPYFLCSGRLYSNFQTLPMQGNPIRAKTTINNLTSCEVDFSANHLRMSAALMGLQLNEDPYTEVQHRSKINDRNHVKRVISALISTSENNTNKAKYGLKNPEDKRQDSIPFSCFDAIHRATTSCFPWLTSVRGIGIYLQSLEGQILMDAMIKLIKDDITALPIHDSLRVPLNSAEKTCMVLQETWSDHLKVNFSTKVSIKNG
jgi:hypothetical protein